MRTGTPADDRKSRGRWEPQDYLPTPDEILEMCREIRNSWTRSERIRRSMKKSRSWSPPTIRVAEIGADVWPMSAY